MVRVIAAHLTCCVYCNRSSQGSVKCSNKSDCPIMPELLRAGDAWQYKPAVCFEVVAPSRAAILYGKVLRRGASREGEFSTIWNLTDIKEREMQSEDYLPTIAFCHTGC